MLDLLEEFSKIMNKFEEENLDYAICGGMAMAIHGFIRATVDIDFVLLQNELQRCKIILNNLGYLLESKPMKFENEAIIIHRFTKVDKLSEDFMVVDILEVTPSIQSAWDNKIKIKWDFGSIWVLDKSGLVQLKKMRNSKIDQEDIERLEENEQN